MRKEMQPEERWVHVRDILMGIKKSYEDVGWYDLGELMNALSGDVEGKRPRPWSCTDDTLLALPVNPLFIDNDPPEDPLILEEGVWTLIFNLAQKDGWEKCKLLCEWAVKDLIDDYLIRSGCHDGKISAPFERIKARYDNFMEQAQQFRHADIDHCILKCCENDTLKDEPFKDARMIIEDDDEECPFY